MCTPGGFDDGMDIMFDDLTPEAQQRLLDLAGIDSPKEANWDIFPVAEVVFDYESGDDECGCDSCEGNSCESCDCGE